MAWHVVIAGGGFGGLQAARTLERVLPPHSARITVLVDWNVGLLFGRDTAELGQLGHPAKLGEESSGGT